MRHVDEWLLALNFYHGGADCVRSIHLGCQTSQEDGFRSTLFVPLTTLAKYTRGEVKRQGDG